MRSPSTPSVDAIPDLFALERHRLLGLLRTLDVEQWLRPTRCPGWTVHDVTLHLLGDDLGFLSRRRDHDRTGAAPTDLDENDFIDWIDDHQRRWVDGARRISPRLAIDLLGWSTPQILAVLRDEDPSRREALVSWAGPDPVPMWLDHLRELSEYWIHRQQLLEALGQPVDLDPTLLEPVLSGLRWAFAHRLSALDPAPAGHVRIEIGDPVDASWDLGPTADGWTFDHPGADPPAAIASLTADQAWRLLTNNLEDDRALDVTGDDRLTTTIRQTRAIIGHPH